MLRDRVEDFIAGESSMRTLHILLDECRCQGDIAALLCTRRLFEDMYGGATFNMQLKAPAAWELACFGKIGIDQLVEAALANSTSKNVSLCVQVLSHIASNLSAATPPVYCDEAQYKLIRERLESDEGLRDYARSKLVEFVLSNDDDNDFVQLISAGFFHLSWDVPDAARELFVAVSARWSAVSKPLLGRYEELIGEHSSDEPVFQRFFTQHPQLLDPMAVTVWPHPRLHGSQIPDFLIRRSDDTYLVVEIETPAKQLVTLQNQLAADATHAVSQVTEYMRFLARISGAQIYFPSIDEIHGLVVVGLERDLNDRQKQALRNDNRQRHAVRIVGFDWLADRAGAIQKNIISTGISVQSAQVS